MKSTNAQYCPSGYTQSNDFCFMVIIAKNHNSSNFIIEPIKLLIPINGQAADKILLSNVISVCASVGATIPMFRNVEEIEALLQFA
jgi:hypothetical protein